jgi:hypothetical protein
MIGGGSGAALDGSGGGPTATAAEELVFALLPGRRRAGMAIAGLTAAGVPVADLSVVVPLGPGVATWDAAEPGVALGPASGLHGQVLAIAGVGPFLVAGPLVGPLRAAVVDPVVGGIAGVLVSLGFPRGQADEFERRTCHGEVLIAVRTAMGVEAVHVEGILAAAQALLVVRLGEVVAAKSRSAGSAGP